MKKIQKIILLLMISVSLNSFSQTIGNYIDVVYLKNGSIIKGIIIEQIPNKSIKVKMSDGSELVYSVSEIEKFTREEITSSSPKQKQVDKNKNSDRIKWINDFKRKADGHFIDIDAMISSSRGFRITNGYRFNKLKYIGIALGLEFTKRDAYMMPQEHFAFDDVPMASINLVYSQDVLDYRITPYYQIEAGYGFALERSIRFEDQNGSLLFRNYGGPMLGMSTGVKFKTKKKIVYKLGLDYKISSNFSNDQFHRLPANSPISRESMRITPAFGLRFGIGF